MYNAMIENVATFASPTIAMTAFLAFITALVTAQLNATGTRTRGSAAVRNTKRDGVWTAMQSLQSYVQVLADALTAESASSLIQSAGMLVAGTGTRTKAVLTAVLLPRPAPCTSKPIAPSSWARRTPASR